MKINKIQLTAHDVDQQIIKIELEGGILHKGKLKIKVIDPDGIFILDDIYNYLIQEDLVGKDQKEVDCNDLSFELHCFANKSLHVGTLFSDVKFNILGQSNFITWDVSDIEVSPDHTFNSILLIAEGEVKTIDIYKGKDVQVVSKAKTLSIGSDLLISSKIQINSQVEYLNIGRMHYSSRTNPTQLGSENLEIGFHGAEIGEMIFVQNVKSFHLGKLSIIDSKISGTLRDCTIGSFYLKNSILQKISLFNITFPNLKSLFNFERSFLKECNFSKVDWGNGINDKNGNFSEIKEIYRMFKNEYDIIGNKTEANKFFAKEMDYYRKSLIENYTWKTFFDVDIGQKRLICWYNLLTNNFGNSWVRPLLWMILLVLLATIFQFLNYDGVFDWKQQVLSNILPIAEIGEFNTWYSFLYQISWAALIYQFIVALRRISQR